MLSGHHGANASNGRANATPCPPARCTFKPIAPRTNQPQNPWSFCPGRLSVEMTAAMAARAATRVSRQAHQHATSWRRALRGPWQQGKGT
eukprot:1988814-Alexandrium_andersonii.AAC.1